MESLGIKKLGSRGLSLENSVQGLRSVIQALNQVSLQRVLYSEYSSDQVKMPD